MSTSVTQLGDEFLGVATAYALSNVGPRRTQPAQTPAGLYAIALRAPSPPYIPLAIYTFPLGPSQIRRQVTGLGNFYDVIGSANKFGVTRIPDIYGQTAPIYTIMGTTGVKYHSGDNFLWTGLESLNILFSIISQYFALNATQAQAGQSSLYKLEFYDYYLGEFWEVVPLGPQEQMQNNARPQLVFYNLHLVAIQSLEQAPSDILDPIFSTIQNGINSAFTASSNAFTSVVNSYTPFNIGTP